MTFCIVLEGESHYLHPKAIFRKDVFSLSWLETSDPHGRICMDPTSKPIKEQTFCQYPPDEAWTVNRRPRWKIKKERQDRWLTSVVNQYTRTEQPRCQHTSRRIAAVFNRRASDKIVALEAQTRPVLLLSFNRCCLPEAKWCGWSLSYQKCCWLWGEMGILSNNSGVITLTVMLAC